MKKTIKIIIFSIGGILLVAYLAYLINASVTKRNAIEYAIKHEDHYRLLYNAVKDKDFNRAIYEDGIITFYGKGLDNTSIPVDINQLQPTIIDKWSYWGAENNEQVFFVVKNFAVGRAIVVLFGKEDEIAKSGDFRSFSKIGEGYYWASVN